MPELEDVAAGDPYVSTRTRRRAPRARAAAVWTSWGVGLRSPVQSVSAPPPISLSLRDGAPARPGAWGASRGFRGARVRAWRGRVSSSDSSHLQSGSAHALWVLPPRPAAVHLPRAPEPRGACKTFFADDEAAPRAAAPLRHCCRVATASRRQLCRAPGPARSRWRAAASRCPWPRARSAPGCPGPPTAPRTACFLTRSNKSSQPLSPRPSRRSS